MTALERALVVYAEAKGYEIELQRRGQIDKWELFELPDSFNFAFCRYRVKNREDYRKTYDELSDFFKPLYTPEKKRTWNIEDLIKYDAPEGFFCKTVTLSNKEIEEMNKPKEEEFDVKAYVKSLVQTPEYLERCKEVDPIIEILEAYKNGENNFEIQSKTSTDEGWKPLEDKPSWNFGYVNYRISPKQPEAIPVTEGELSLIDSYAWFRDPEGKCQYSFKLYVGENIGWHIFNPGSKTWQDWGKK